VKIAEDFCISRFAVQICLQEDHKTKSIIASKSAGFPGTAYFGVTTT
jgi:hypothetical protein